MKVSVIEQDEITNQSHPQIPCWWNHPTLHLGGVHHPLVTVPGLGLDKLCNLLCFSVMLITCSYYTFKVNLLCSIMLQKLVNNNGKYSQNYNCVIAIRSRKRATSASATVTYIRRLGISHSKSKRCNHVSLHTRG